MKLRVESSESKATGSKLSRFQALQLNRLCCHSVDQMPDGKNSAGEMARLVFTSHESPITSHRFSPTVWESFMVKPNERLVRVSYVHCCTSTSRLSRS